MLVDKHTGQTLARVDKPVYEVIRPAVQKTLTNEQYHQGLLSTLESSDPDVYRLLTQEYDRQQSTL